MARRNQQPIEFEDFDGIHSYPRWTGRDSDVEGMSSVNGGEKCYDLQIAPQGYLLNRPGLSRLPGVGTYGALGIKRVIAVNLSTAATPCTYLILGYDGKVYNNNSTVAIYTAAAGSDLAVLVLGDRVYLSVTPTAGNAGIFVYDCSVGGATVRAAAGLKPAGTFTVATSAIAGHIETGQHIYAVAYETSTGYITKPNLYVSLTNVASRKVDMNPIPTGPAGTVARHILMSRVLKNWDGNLQNPELFFALRIADNTTTTLTGANGLDKYDSELVSSADYLKDLTEELIRANAMCLYSGRVVHAGGSSTNPVRVSQPGDWESFLATEGYLKAYPLEGSLPTRNCAELNGVLYVYRDTKTYASQDTGESPTRWPVIRVHPSLGTTSRGICTTGSAEIGASKHLFILNQDGLYLFDGAYGDLPLTYKIGGLYRDLVIDAGGSSSFDVSNWSVVIDEQRKAIYVFVGKAPSSYRPATHTPVEPENYNTIQVLVGDYSRGLAWDKIRWVGWRFYNWLQCMTGTLDPLTAMVQITFGQGDQDAVHAMPGWLMTLNLEAVGTQILAVSDVSVDGVERPVNWIWLSGPVGLGTPNRRTNFEAAGVRVASLAQAVALVPTVAVRLYNADDDVFTALPNIVLAGRPNYSGSPVPNSANAKSYLSQGNVTAERVKLELSGSTGISSTNTRGVKILSAHLYGHIETEEVPG